MIRFDGSGQKIVYFLLSLCTKHWSKDLPSIFLGSVFGIIVCSQSCVFFSWEATRGKIITLDQLQKKKIAPCQSSFPLSRKRRDNESSPPLLSKV